MPSGSTTTYSFVLTSDDGSLLFINDALVIDNGGAAPTLSHPRGLPLVPPCMPLSPHELSSATRTPNASILLRLLAGSIVPVYFLTLALTLQPILGVMARNSNPPVPAVTSRSIRSSLPRA